MAVVLVPDRLQQKICLNFLLFPEIWSLAPNNSGKAGRFSLFPAFGCGEALAQIFQRGCGSSSLEMSKTRLEQPGVVEGVEVRMG